MKIRWKRLFAWSLSAVLLGTAPGITLYAEEASGQTEALSSGGLCEHHQEHDEDCGYQEEAGETSCTYLCSECNSPKTPNPEPSQSPEPNTTAPGQEQTPGQNTTAPGQAQTPGQNTTAPGQAQTPGQNTTAPGQTLTPVQGEPVQSSPEADKNDLEHSDSQQADTRTISSWSWVDEEALLNEDILILSQCSEDQTVSAEELLSLLPKEILASIEDTEETIVLEGWNSPDYPEEGACTGSFLFQALLPEGYALAQEAAPLEITVQFTDPADNGLQTLADEGTIQDKSNGLIFETPSYLPTEETTYKAGTGQIIWKPTLENGKVVSGQLILKDAEIKDCTLGIQMPVHTEIVLEGNNKITTENRLGESKFGLGISITDSYGINTPPLDLTITGAGSLEIDSQDSGITLGGNLTVDQVGQLTITYGSDHLGAHGLGSTIADHTIAIRDCSNVVIRSREGMTSDASGAVYLQNSGNVIIENSHVIFENSIGPAIGTVAGNIQLLSSDVRAIGNTSSENLYGTLIYTKFTMDQGTLYLENKGTDDGLPSTPGRSFLKQGAVIYFKELRYLPLVQGDGIWYRTCTYDESSDKITKVGNGFVYGTVTWNENILFSDGTTLYIGSNCKNGNALCTIPEGMTVEVPDQCQIDCTSTTSSQTTGTLVNNGTLHIQNGGKLLTSYRQNIQLGGTIQNHGQIHLSPGALLQNQSRLENSGTIEIEGNFETIHLTGFDAVIENTGTINGFVVDRKDTSSVYMTNGTTAVRSGQTLTLGQGVIDGSKDRLLQIQEGTKMTIEANAVVDARTNLTKDTLSQYLSTEGELVIEGELWLPEDTTPEDLQTLAEHVSGTGTVITGSGANSVNYYIVSVLEAGENISGKGLYQAGDTVSVSAGSREGHRFKSWSASEGVVLADASASDTTFVMPEHFVAITAQWDILAERVELEHVTLSLHPEDTAVLHVTFIPADASDQRVTWASNHPEIAEVDADGNITAKAPGTAIITVTALDGGLTASCMVTVEKVPDLPIPPQDSEETRLVLEQGIKDIPSTLREKGLDTSEKIETALKLEISQKQASFSGGSTILYDVTLMVRRQGSTQWEIADVSNFPSDGKLQVSLPYPEGTGKDTHDFLVAHMFTVAAFGRTPGDIELPTITKTESDLQFEVTGLSPILLTWKEISVPGTQEPSNNDGDSGSGDSGSSGGSSSSVSGSSSSGSSHSSGSTPQASSQPLPAGAATGDTSHPIIWLMTALFCGGFILLLLKKKKQTAL